MCPVSSDSPLALYDRLTALVRASGAAHRIHEHEPTRTMEDARRLSLDRSLIVKTVVFRRRDGALVLAALPGFSRVDYPALAALAGVGRRDLAPLSAVEVSGLLGVEPGAVSPLCGENGELTFLDEGIFALGPVILCGIGRPDRTLQIAPEDLARLCGGRVGRFSR